MVALGFSQANAGPFGGIHDTDSGFGITPSGVLFTQTLYDGYKTLSDDRNTGFDNGDAELFNHKAEAAGKRSPVDTDLVMDRDLKDGEKTPFFIGLDRLYAVYDKGGRELAPVETGTAVVAFDCWIEATEGGRDEDAKVCRDKFEQAIAAAEAKAGYEIAVIEVAPPTIPQKEPEVAQAPAPAVVPPKEYYLVFFEFDKTIFTPEGESNLQQAIKDVKDIQSLNISLRAHADRSGSNDYNIDLSRRRAEAVLDRLAQAGISDSRLHIVEAVGENQPLIPTPDGVRNQQNRVVEIDLRQ